MAKFRDSSAITDIEAHPFGAGSLAREQGPSTVAAESPTVVDRTIGDIIAELRNLTAEQVEHVLVHQRQTGVRFGEAAVALGLATRDDVLFALSQQFHYPYAPEEQRAISPELVALHDPFSSRAESFRALRSQLMMRVFADDQPRHALAVVSPSPGDGKTYCAANLAVALAQLGGRTLLIDADMRGPRLHELFGLENRTGLSGILSGRSDSNVIQQVAVVPSLFVLPVGVTPPNPLELVERSAFGLLLRELVNKFNHVIVDTPAASYGSDACVTAARCGAALVVARRNARVGELHELTAALASTPAKIAGAIMNEW